MKGRLPAVTLLALLSFLQWQDPLPVEAVRTRIFDFYQTLHPRPPLTPYPVVIADIDEKSLSMYGQWPWPRTLVAQLVLALNHAGVKAIGFDVVFAEGDRTSPENSSRFMMGLDDLTYEKLQKLPRNDTVFAKQLEIAPTVLGQSVINETPKGKVPPYPKTSVNTIGRVTNYLPSFPFLVRNIPELETASKAQGVISLISERDGVIRRVPSAVVIGETVFSSFGIEVLRVALGQKSIDIKAKPNLGISALRVNPVIIPTDPLGRIWIYFSPWDDSRSYSVHDILTGTIDAQLLRNRIVLIGTSASGLLDLRVTPLGDVVPGVEVHAQVIEMILSENFLKRPGWTHALEILCTLSINLLLILLVPALGARTTALVSVLSVASLTGASWFLFYRHGTLFDASFPGVSVFIILSFLVFSNYLREQKEKRYIRGTFSQYVSPALVDQLANAKQPVRLGGETKEMTILFCDIRGFTNLSEQLKDAPEKLTALINQLLTPLSHVVLEHNGTIDKYIGDCVMAFWNAPVTEKHHRYQACAAALEMSKAVVELNKRNSSEAEAGSKLSIPFAIGIGINSGYVVVGNMGSDMRFDYSVLGDAVNLASRLEGQSKIYGAEIIVGEDTALELAGDFAFIELDLIAVKGKSQGVRVFTLKGGKEFAVSQAFQEQQQTHHDMLTAYRSQDWNLANDLAQRLQVATPDMQQYYDLIRNRIRTLKKNPPPSDWKGLYVSELK